jgi:N-acetylglutamate synthase-like GNAT family acetyltransferase
MLTFVMKEPETFMDFQAYYQLRWQLLRKPWGQTLGSERDELEDDAWHRMCLFENDVIGVGRLHLQTAKQGQIRYMAVDEVFQGKGVGSMLLTSLQEQALQLGIEKIVLNSRESAVGFYETHGFKCLAPSHCLYGQIQHYEMEKVL